MTLSLLAYVLGGLSALLIIWLTLQSTPEERERHSWLRFIDSARHRIWLWVAAAALGVLAFAVGFVDQVLTPRTEPVETSGGFLVARATTAGFEADLRQRSQERADEARDYFVAGQRELAAGRYREAATAYGRSIAAVPTISANLNLGIANEYLSDYPSALAAFGSALRFAEASKDREYQAIALTHLGIVYQERGLLEEAERNVDQGLAIAKQLTNSGLINGALMVKARVLDARGDPKKSAETILAVLKYYRERKDKRGQAAALNNLGHAQLDQGQLSEALKSYRAAGDLYQEINDPIGKMKALTNIGNAQADKGEMAAAEQAYRDALALAQQTGSRKGEADALNNLGELERQKGDFANAVKHLRTAHEVSAAIGNLDGQGNALTNLGNAMFMSHDYDAAGEYFRRAADVFREAGEALGENQALGNAAEVRREQKRFAEAVEFATRALTGFKSIENLQGEANTYNSLGNTFIMMRRYSESMTAFESGLAVATTSGDKGRQAIAIAGKGEVLLDTGRVDESLEQSNIARQMLHDLGDPNEAAVIANIGLAYEKKGLRAKALEELERSVKMFSGFGIFLSQMPEISSALARLRRKKSPDSQLNEITRHSSIERIDLLGFLTIARSPRPNPPPSANLRLDLGLRIVNNGRSPTDVLPGNDGCSKLE